MTNTVLTAENISYLDQLSESSFELKKGFTTLMGPSGSGKSTCAMLLVGALKLSSGKVSYLSDTGTTSLNIYPETNSWVKKIQLESAQNRRVKRHIIRYCGYVAQTPELPRGMTVKDYIYNVRTAAGNKLDVRYLDWLLNKLGIAKNMDKIAASQSGGEQQRTAVAFALANKPSLFIADEPNASLDTKSGKEVLELTRSLADNGMSVLWITHTPEHQDYADNKLYAENGVVYE